MMKRLQQVAVAEDQILVEARALLPLRSMEQLPG